MNYKKLLGSLFIISMLTSCDLDSVAFINNSSTNQTSTNTNSNNGNQVIEISKSNGDSEVSTIETAIAKVYDSVVVINAYTKTGYGSGAGVIIGKSTSDDSYYVITCHHVIESASSFEVRLSDGTKKEGTLVGGDPDSDIAVLQIHGENLCVSSFLSDSNSLRLGQTAIAIGNPLGTLSNTVTCGIVSSVNREITFSDGTAIELIQTDAAINSGNSGGGLFDINGNLIGVVNAKYASSGVEGLGFAIPSNLASYIASSLISNGYVEGRYNLGITISDGVYYERWYNQVHVVYISDVEYGSSCYGYLQENDILKSISIDYYDVSKEDISLTTINEASEANSFISSADLTIGDKITFTIKRNNQESSVEVEIKQYKYQVE